MRQYAIQPGSRYPFGATADAQGVNFSIWSQHARTVELRLYESPTSPKPLQVIRLDPEVHRTFFSWHVYVEGLPTGTWYTWRMEGPNDVDASGLRFDGEKDLLDPWARGVSDRLWDRERAKVPGDNGGTSLRAVVLGDGGYDWEGDQPLRVPAEDMVIYEVHVGGFTRHRSAEVSAPGTFLGLVDKIPYLVDLGVTHVELMPVMAFDEQDVPKGAVARGLKNFWGYSTHSFFAPHPGFCVAPEQGSPADEFRDMVKALHRAGIGVILDVVFNHTSEAGADGPTVNFKGIDNAVFYHLDRSDRSKYRDYTGCGNTVNCNHPLVSRFITRCLEYWVREMHVDGFRFDLASVLARTEEGVPAYHAHTPWNIEFSEVLAQTALIAEAWDAGGLYQVGQFPGYRWAEWNGKYRDIIRRFVRGEPGLIGEVASRLSGSSDLYEASGRLPSNSVNFVTCHDGFTLHDLVSYNEKHNWENGEENRDGSSDNLSWNCGVEGPTDDLQVKGFRQRQARNFMAVLLLSQGVPMLLAGDEVLRSQQGNNNTYCQDNELGWFDWAQVKRQGTMFRFVREMIRLRKRHRSLMRSRFLTGRTRPGMRMPDVTWHGSALFHPRWDDGEARVLAFTLGGLTADEEDLHVMLNMSDGAVDMEVPLVDGRKWHIAVDTSRESPRDVVEVGRQQALPDGGVRVEARSVVVLESR